MYEEIERTRGRLLSKLLLIRSDLEGVNKKQLDKEMKVLLEGIESRVEILIKNLIGEKNEKIKI